MSYKHGDDKPFCIAAAPVFSWHKTILERLHKSKDKKRVSHAMLFVGYSGIGKRQFAEKLANLFLCEEKTGPCGTCRSCQLFQADTHPDFFTIEPEGQAEVIKIDQVRDFIWQIDKTPQVAKCKIVIIDPADKLNPSAANALLKTLEEPSPNTYFMLITSRLNALPATIRSRCQIIRFKIPSILESKEWIRAQKECDCYSENEIEAALRVAGGAPMQTVHLLYCGNFRLHQEIFLDWMNFLQGKSTLVQISTKWHSKNVILIIEWLISFVEDLIRFKQTKQDEYFTQIDIKNDLIKLVAIYTIQELFHLYDALTKSRELLLNQTHVNEQLLLEHLLLLFRKK